MKKIITISLALSMLILGACAIVKTDDIKISADVDPKANFSGYKTYTWLGSASILNDPDGRWEPPSFDADTEIKFLIDRELRKRGMSESAAQPDMIIGFALGVDMDSLQLKIDKESKMETLESVPKGALVIAAVDTSTGFVIWVSDAEANVQSGISNDEMKKRLDYAVTKMIAKMPK
ncbi:hypothetical protein MNBD_GAMMA25-2335 [hydrothermal vent metagenome]|uniref:DUF4136 domain-containing protein n=1 Tax=hydrothermal vent metagenome TaxID=652676 RepID=A0A3B1BCH1_9ZZZZ